MAIKDSLKTLLSEVDDLLTEVEDSDELDDEDVRAEIIDYLDEAENNVADAILCLGSP